MKTKFTESDIGALNEILANAICQSMKDVYDRGLQNLSKKEFSDILEEITQLFKARLNTIANIPAEVPGELSDKNYLSVYVGEGKTDTDKKFSLNVGAVTFSPIVETDSKKYALTWDDIVQLAEDKVLFDDEGEV